MVLPERMVLFIRLALLTLGIYLTGGGISTLSTGRAAHTNYLQAPVSATVALTVGVLLLFFGTLGWKWISRYL